MTRLPLSRFVPRSTGGRSRTHRHCQRSLRLEPLDARVVLSGIPEVVGMDVATDGASGPASVDAAPMGTDAAAEGSALVTDDGTPVQLDGNGVLHVRPETEHENIAVRQFVNYRLQEVIEVKAAGCWTAFPAAQVQRIEIQTLAASQKVEISDRIGVPVELASLSLFAEDAVDAVLATAPQTSWVDAPRGEVTENTSAQPLLPVMMLTSGPEGEGPGGGEVEPVNSPPTITGFSGQKLQRIWCFTGTVVDDGNVAGLTVRFGGLLSGKTTTTTIDGTFEFTWLFPPGTMGGVSAVTTDTDGLDSETVYTFVIN